MTDQLTIGLRRQRKILHDHEEAKGWLLDEIDRRLIARVGHGGTCTIDAAHEILDEILAEDVDLGFPEARIDRRWLGALMPHRDHWINTNRIRATRRPERNAAKIPIWKLDKRKLEGGP